MQFVTAGVVGVDMNRKLHFLQVLRAIAALLVVASHAILYVNLNNSTSEAYGNLSGFLGAFGVALFFVISGFIMIYTSNRLFHERGGSLEFVIRRIVRIVPLYWIATAVAMLLGALHQLPSATSVASSLFFIPVVNDPGQPLRPILGVGWTLNLEMFFYLIFAVSLLFSRTLGVLFLVVTMLSLVAFGTALKPLTDTAEPTSALTFLSDPILLLFTAGVVLGVAIERPRRILNIIPYSGYLSLAIVGLATLTFSLAVDQWPIPFGWQSLFRAAAVLSIFLAVIAPPPGRNHFLRVMEYIGDASYSIYLFHYITTAATGRLWKLLFGNVDGLYFIPAAFLSSCLVGTAIHIWVERPLGLLLRFRAHKPVAGSPLIAKTES